MVSGYEIEDLCAVIKRSSQQLFHINYEAIIERENGLYFILFAKPTKRLQAVLSLDREVLVLGNTYSDQQARTISVAEQIIREQNGRLESKIFFIAHRDSRGNAKLKKWGREHGITVLPVYVPPGTIDRIDLEKILSYEFYSQDPFDVTGPVATDNQFFGRRTEAQELARKLQGGQIRACFGIRKIGKTSIMHRVLQEVESHYDCITIFIDCQSDAVFRLNASQLIFSLAATLDSALAEARNYSELSIIVKEHPLEESAKLLSDVIQNLECPLIIAFDEVDYITPGNSIARHWQTDFIEFWRNIRAIYQSSTRLNKKVSLLVCGVSSKWFSVESIDGVENAALAFVPEEYLNPLSRGAATAMIKNVGSMAGLNFSDKAADLIASACSDMPFWIRKCCSFIHGRIDTASRPVQVFPQELGSLITTYIKDEGASLAQVALQHLFRVYPEIKGPCIELYRNSHAQIRPATRRTLVKYGLVQEAGGILFGEMLNAGLQMIADEQDAPNTQEDLNNNRGGINFDFDEWLEELQSINRRRNAIERKLRELAVNFLKFQSISAGNLSGARDRVLACLPTKRRDELGNLNLDLITEKLFWLELKSIISKEWSLFERILGDRKKVEDCFDILNDRPDAHAKKIDKVSVALYRRELEWMEERLSKI
jgi:hypothetical protein